MRKREGSVRSAGWIVLLGVLLASLVLATAGITGASGSDIEEAKARLADANLRYEEAHGALHDLEERVEQLSVREERASTELEGLNERLQASAVESYRRNPAISILSTKDLTRRMRADALIRSVRGDQTDVIDDARVAQERLETLRQQLGDAQDAEQANIKMLDESRADLEAELSRLEESERARLLAEQAEEQRKAREAASASARAEAAREAAVISRRLAFEPGDPQGDEPIASGKDFVCPVQGAHSFIDSWGFARSGGRRHQGVDMMANHGTLLVAPVDGNVEFRSNSIGGLSFHLSGDNGNYYYGTHLQGYEGENRWVQAGTVIGYVGSSGNASASGPHLHFEIHPGHGSATNPFPTTSQYCEGG